MTIHGESGIDWTDMKSCLKTKHKIIILRR